MARTRQPAKKYPLVVDPEHLKQGEVALLLGITTQAVRKWKSPPRNRDGSYSLPDIWAWWKAIPGDGGEDSESAMLAMMAPEDKARLLKAKADHEVEKVQITRMERLRQEGKLVDLSEFENMLQRAAVPLRRFAEALQRRHPELVNDYHAACDAAMEVLGVEETA